MRNLIFTGLAGILTCGLSLAGQPDNAVMRVRSFVQQIHRPFTTEDGLPSNDIRSLVIVGDSIYAATDAGLVEYFEGTWKPLDLVTDGGTTSTHKCEDGSIIVADTTLHFVPDTVPSAAINDLKSQTITRLLVDESRLWGGTPNGLVCWLDDKYERFHSSTGSSEGTVQSMILPC